MTTEYLIQGDTLFATADKIRECLNLPRYSIDPSVIESEGKLIVGSVEAILREYVDWDGREGGIIEYDRLDTFIAYDFLVNNKGKTVPVLYDTAAEGEFAEIPDTDEPFFYEGTAVINNVMYDKWRKIQVSGSSDVNLTWTSTEKKYVYTDTIVIDNGGIDPLDFPEKIDEVYEAGVASAEQETPTISVDAFGLITATAGDKSATHQLTTQGAKTITPSKLRQTAIAAGTYATGNVTVKGDSNLVAPNIPTGVTIFGVGGMLGVCDAAYINGRLNASAGNNVLYGAYVFADTFNNGWTGTLDCTQYEVYSYALVSGVWSKRKVTSIASQTSMTVNITMQGGMNYYHTLAKIWYVNNNPTPNPTDKRFKVIEFVTPVTVASNLYSAFKVWTNTDETPYDIGYACGAASV